MRNTGSDRYSLIKGQGLLSANIIAGRDGKGIMNNDFTVHVYVYLSFFFFSIVCIT